ncbi:DNA repair protein RecO [Candidatus Bipolaricaulota bacterium]|nr:DNA repair protein RecO [Candidatus Bipolaricaulota bacterium]
MGLERGEGFVLRTRPYAEADLIVTLFLEKKGKRTGIAKGVRRLNSRLGGVFDLLNRIEVVFYPHRGLDLLSQGSVLEAYLQIKRNLAAVESALAVARLLDRLLPSHQPEDGPYHLFSRFLALLPTGDPLALQTATELKLLALLGHRPHLNACQRCGRKDGPFRFVPGRGGILCASCAQGIEGVPVDAGLVRTLDWLLTHPLERSKVVKLSPAAAARTKELISTYIEVLGRGT